jgi:virginiamycin A acetyltransferase
VVEGARLESVYTVKGIKGSNPFLSAKLWTNKKLTTIIFIVIKFFKKCKKNHFFLNDFLKDQVKQGHTIIGKWSYGNPAIYRWDSSKLKIGNFCSFGPEVKIYIGGNHRSDWITTSPLPIDEFSSFFTNAADVKNFTKEKKSLEIGSDVWVGGHSIILSGLKIGHGCVIGAGSVVRESLDPYSIAIGNPAKTIKKRFNEQVIEKLLQYPWWELDDRKINILAPFLLSENFDLFFEKLILLKKQV